MPEAWKPLVLPQWWTRRPTPRWVAEEPEAHLLPQLAAAAAVARHPVRIRGSRTDADGTFVVDLEWVGPAEPTRPAIRSVLFDLVGAVAETVTLVHEPSAGGGRELEVLTGILDGEGPFAGHGHTLRLTVAVPDHA